MVRKRRPNDFDDIARYYDLLAKIVFGNSLNKSQLTFIHLIPEKASVLIIGGGTGWVMNQLLWQKPKVNITYVELSKVMIRKAKRRLNPDFQNNVLFIHGDETAIAQQGETEVYDVVITNFFLDIFKSSGLRSVMQKLKSSLKIGGTWIYTDFINPPSGGLYRWKRFLIKFMYVFFRFAANMEGRELLNHHEYFTELGLSLSKRKIFFYKMVEARTYLKSPSCP